MDPELRRAWTEIVTAGDYERHMAAIGQAQAAAQLTGWMIAAAEPHRGARIAITGAGTGQMLDFLDPGVLRPFALTFSDLNPAYLDVMRARLVRHGLAADVWVDDIERTELPPGPDLLVAALLLEHIDWRRGVEAFAKLRPRACGVVIQENPPGMTSAVTPGRRVPPSIEEAMRNAHATLIDRPELETDFAGRGYRLRASESVHVADGKRLVGLLFVNAAPEPGE